MSHPCLRVSGKPRHTAFLLKTVAACIVQQCFVILGGAVFDVFSSLTMKAISKKWQGQSVLNGILMSQPTVFAGQ